MLPEDRRKQLDGIVKQMVDNGETDDAIGFVVNDFKNKYSTKEDTKTFSEKTASVLDTIFGGGKVGEAIGTKIASVSKAGKDLKRQEELGIAPKGSFDDAFKMPSRGEIVGSALQSAALFTPGGTLASGITKGLSAVGLKTGVSALGKIGSGVIAGAAFDVATNLQQGKTGAQALTPGIGALIGGAVPSAGVAKNVSVRFGEKQAPRIINSLIKPLAKDFAYGKNPGRAIAEEGIIANNFDDLIEGIRTSRQRIGQEIGSLTRNLAEQPLLNIRPTLLPLDEALQIAASQNNPTLLSRLNNVKRAITEVLEPVADEAGNLGIRSVGSRDLDNLTFSQARAILSDIGELTAFTGNPSDDKLVNSALKRVYGGIKQETLNLARKVNPEAASRFEKLTEKYGDLLSAEVAAKYRDKIVERQNLIGLSPTSVGIGTGIITAVSTGGATIPAILAGVTGAAIDKLASTPAFKTRLAYLLSAKTQREANYLYQKLPFLEKFFPKGSPVTPGDRVLQSKPVQKYLQDPKVGMSIKNVAQNIHPEDSAIMKKFIDMARINKKMSNAEFDMASKLAEKFGISMDSGLKNVANSFENVLSGAKKVTGTNYPGSVKGEGAFTGNFKPTASNSLIQEAKKYKSAEEFVKAKPTVYRGEGGSNVAQGKALLAEGKHYASDAEYPKGFGKVGEYALKPDAKVLDLGDSTFAEISKKLGIPEKKYISPTELSKIAREQGYDVVKYQGEYASSGKKFSHTVDLTGNSYIPKSQLTDIWKQANKK